MLLRDKRIQGYHPCSGDRGGGGSAFFCVFTHVFLASPKGLMRLGPTAAEKCPLVQRDMRDSAMLSVASVSPPAPGIIKLRERSKVWLRLQSWKICGEQKLLLTESHDLIGFASPGPSHGVIRFCFVRPRKCFKKLQIVMSDLFHGQPLKNMKRRHMCVWGLWQEWGSNVATTAEEANGRTPKEKILRIRRVTVWGPVTE